MAVIPAKAGTQLSTGWPPEAGSRLSPGWRHEGWHQKGCPGRARAKWNVL